MIAIERCALVLLAAGRSERFGPADKLEHKLDGVALAFHVVSALADLPFAARFAVCSNAALDFAGRGYRVLHNDDPAAGQARSVRLGVAAAMEAGCQSVMIALADMPRVSAQQILRLFAASEGLGAGAVVASSNGVHPGPPALFGADRFAALLALEGDEGARAMIRAGRHVIAGEGELLDIDRPEDLARLR